MNNLTIYMTIPDTSDEKSMKELRYEHPSGWLHFIRDSSEGLHLIIDTLLSASDREFTKSETGQVIDE